MLPGVLLCDNKVLVKLCGSLSGQFFDLIQRQARVLGDFFISQKAICQHGSGRFDGLGIGGFFGSLCSGLIPHLFQKFAHTGAPPFVLFEISYLCSQQFAEHIGGIGTIEIVHQPPDRMVDVAESTVHIENVCSIAEKCVSKFRDFSLDVVEGKSFVELVVAHIIS